MVVITNWPTFDEHQSHPSHQSHSDMTYETNGTYVIGQTVESAIKGQE